MHLPLHRAGRLAARLLRLAPLLALPLVPAGCGGLAGPPPAEARSEAAAPELATGYQRGRLPVRARGAMVVAAHPLAAEAGRAMLAQGGSAVDAAVAVQMVLALVEPQSSGIGGGAFLLLHEAGSGRLRAYDGRETAPAAATENYTRWISEGERRPPRPNLRASGRSIGTPGVVAMLALAHADAGRLPWPQLFGPAIAHARAGFEISPRLAASIAASARGLARDPEARAHFLLPDGRPRPAGSRLANPALADTFTALAQGGAAAFYQGPLAQDIVDEIHDTAGGTTPGLTTRADLAGYRALRREALCTPYRRWWVCGMPPPSSGGMAVAQTLGLLAHFDLAALAPPAPGPHGGRPPPEAVHLVAEAERLAYADRDRYVADADFVPLPGGSPGRLLAPEYLRQRAALIRPERSLGTAAPGDLGGAPAGEAPPLPEQGTTQVVIADAEGNVVSLTSSVESAFGALRMTRGGFLLNNQLTDFSAEPADAQGRPIANRVGPGKRPRSSMAPTLVFHRGPDGGRGEFFAATGSPGGAAIIQFVVKTLVGLLDWGLDAQQAAALIDFGAANGPLTQLGAEHPEVDAGDGGARDALVAGLRARGHLVSQVPRSSGIATLLRRSGAGAEAVYEGGADPRREGVALGLTGLTGPRQAAQDEGSAKRSGPGQGSPQAQAETVGAGTGRANR